jgi:hypothetical protein
MEGKRIEHTLKKWEKKYGYIGLSPSEREFFSDLKGKYFKLKILGKEILQRKIDDEWRIYVSKEPLEDLEVDDTIIISRDKKGNYYIEKE